MPGVFEAFTFIVLSISAGSLSGVVAGVGALLSGIGGTLLSVGISYLSSVLNRPKQPKPEDVQSSVRNATAHRQGHYGKVKTSGPWVFGEAKGGGFYKVLALGTGRFDAIEEFWVDDRIVTLNGGGVVTQEPYDGNLIIRYRLGLPTETHYPELTAAFPEWDADHRGDGVASLFAYQDSVGASAVPELFPNLTQTGYRVVARGRQVYNPVTETFVWSDNAADVIRGYMTHPDGMRLPESMFLTPDAKAGWVAAHERSAVEIPMKAGGMEHAYRLWGSYTYDERPADVLGRMLVCSDSMVVPTPDGGITLDIGTWQEPSVVIDEDAITGFSELSRGRDIMSSANVITATYLSTQHDYQATEADRWVMEDDVAARGEITSGKEFNMAPSHGQARRLMKLAAYRQSPKWIGTFQCNLLGLAAFGKRFIRIRYASFGIDEVFEVVDFRFEIGEGQILSGVTLVVQSMPQEAYTWDAMAEEGTPPIAETAEVDRTVPVPTGVTFTEEREISGGSAYSVGRIACNTPPSPSLRVEAEYKKTTDSEWTAVSVAPDTSYGRTGVLQDNVQYGARMRHVTSTGRASNWSSTATMTPIANPTPPVALITPGASNGTGLFNATFGTANDPNLARVAIYRAPSGVPLNPTTHLAAQPAVAPGISYSVPVTSASGSYDVYMRPLNQSSVAGPLAGPFAVTVT